MAEAGHEPRDRRGRDRRVSQSPIAHPDRRDGQRRSGRDRRNEPRGPLA